MCTIEKNQVDMFIASHTKYFNQDKIILIKEHISKMDESQFMIVNSFEYKDPMIMFVISLLIGGLGVDRFMLGDTGMGVLKLLTGGCFGVLTIIDWFNISKKTKEYNFQKLMNL